jgi:hypothetical protein
MHRHPRRILTILAILIIFSCTAFSRCGSAQEEESVAPWRMTELDQLDIPTPETDLLQRQPEIWNSTSPSLYSFQFASRFQYAIPRAPEVVVSPYRQGMRGTLKRSGELTIGVALEKDPGEKQYWDHASIAASCAFPRNRLHFLLGDYRVRYGGGLVIRTARNYGLPYSADATLFSSREGIQTYCGWDENVVLRGAAMEGNFRTLDFSIWGSRRSRDAQLDSAGNVSFFSGSGLHRTEMEISRRNACLEEVVGAQTGWHLFDEKLRLGAVVYGIRWNHPILNSDALLTKTMVGGVQADYRREPVRLSFEAARDREANAAFMGAMRIKTLLTQSLFTAYYVDSDYFSPLSAGLDFDFGKTANRQGVYTSLAFPRLFLHPSGFCHVYSFPQLEQNSSRGGQDLQLQILQMIRRPVSFAASARWVQEDEAESGLKTNHWFGSGSIRVTPDIATRIQTEIRLCRAQGTNAVGRMLRLQFEHSRRILTRVLWRGNISAGIYNAPNSLVKLYWYDVDWSGNFFLRQLQGSGGIWQLEITAHDSDFGKLGWILYWDVPAESSNQATYYSIAVNYQFP